MKRILFLCGIFALVFSFFEVPLHAQSLLAGKTPANMGAAPSGWQVLATEDFESGSVGANAELQFSSVSTAQAHGGTHAMVEVIPANGGGNQSPGGQYVFHTPVTLPSNGHIYMSWYSYLDPNAYNQTEAFFAAMNVPTQALIMDTQQGNGSSANLWFSPQTGANPQAPDCANGPEFSGLPQNCGFYGARWNLNLGTWEQEELEIQPSTCTGSTPNNDGFVTMWINGQQVYHIDANNSADRVNPMGGNINGCVDMSNHPDLQVAGIWTYFSPNPSTFNKYVDDIIILQRSGGAPAPAVGFSPSSYTFANQNITTSSSPHAISLTNTGNATLSISSINLTGADAGDFSKTTTCGATVAAGANCAINVTFTPTVAGNRVASISVTDNAGGSPHTVLLAGTGVNPANSGISLSASSITFPGTVVSSTSSDIVVTVTSTGTANLAIPTITFTGTNSTNFAVHSTTCPTSATLATNSTCTINVDFTPSATGTRTASMNVNDNAPGSPHLVSLTGTGISGATSFSSIVPTSFNFNSQTLATASSGQVFTLTNTGGASLTFTSITVGGTNSADFGKADTCLPGPVAAAGSCTITITFTPHGVGSRSGTVTVATNATNSPNVIALLGTGTSTAPSTTAQPQTPDVAHVPALAGINAKWVEGVGPGYWATAGSGLTLNLTSGTSWCAGVIVNYTGSTLTMTNNTTNYVYLNTASSCVPAVKTSAFVVADIPISTVVTSNGVITQISDDRTTTSTGSAASGQHNSGDYTCAMVTGCGAPSNSTTMHLHDEFCGGAAGPLTYSDESAVKTSIGELGWNIGSSLDSGLSYQLVNPIVANHPCIASFGTTSTSDWDYLVLGDTTNKYANPTTYTFDWNGTLKNAAIHGGELRWGMFDNFGTQNGHGVWFDTTQTGSTTDWFCKAVDSGGTASVDSGILADTNWHNLEIIASASSTVIYKIDGTQVCSISTHVPNVNVAAGMEIIGNGSGGATFNIDYADLTITVSRQ